MLLSAFPPSGSSLLACPVCLGPLAERVGAVRCRTCDLRFGHEDGVYLLGPPFAVDQGPETFFTERMRGLLEEAGARGWEDARGRFTSDVLDGTLRAPSRSRWARARAKLTGTTWEDTLQDLVDPTRGGWKFLLGLHQGARVLFLGPSWGAAPLSLARSCAHVIVLDGLLERLQLTARQAQGSRLENLTFARVVDPLHLPLPDASVDLVAVPGLAEWFTAVCGERPVPPHCGDTLLRELRRVLLPGGQVYVATDNRFGVSWLLGGRRPSGTAYTPRGLRKAAAAAGFASCSLFAPVPFRHKFHQILDLERSDRMNFCADPYRTRGRVLRPLVKAWDRCNKDGAVERRLYPSLPGLGAVLATAPAPESIAERVIRSLSAQGQIPASAASLTRYFIRPKGVAVLGAGPSGEGGVVVRLPLDERAEASCARHHRTIVRLADDRRIPTAVRNLFPAPLAEGMFEGQVYFAESARPGESGRLYYSLPARRYDQAILNAAEALRQLRRATEEPTLITRREYDRLCGLWLAELKDIVGAQNRPAIEAIAALLEETLLGATLPLGWYHGDYDFANLLYGPDDAVTGILDFEIFDPHGLPLIDLLLLLARRPIRKGGMAFGTLFVRCILGRELPPLEAKLLAAEMQTLGIDDRTYRAIALCCWLNHLRLRRDSWLVRSPSWLESNLHEVVESVRSIL
jgi:aminoglycoside phosphotransferase (APT) family kinase protein/SAM-dependent methyltransferase